jgi:hypothetical protein
MRYNPIPFLVSSNVPAIVVGAEDVLGSEFLQVRDPLGVLLALLFYIVRYEIGLVLVAGVEFE